MKIPGQMGNVMENAVSRGGYAKQGVATRTQKEKPLTQWPVVMVSSAAHQITECEFK
jgi:hypothetical protein